eukprot:PhF_6_TR20465/c1_g2_i2/m.29431
MEAFLRCYTQFVPSVNTSRPQQQPPSTKSFLPNKTSGELLGISCSVSHRPTSTRIQSFIYDSRATTTPLSSRSNPFRCVVPSDITRIIGSGDHHQEQGRPLRTPYVVVSYFGHAAPHVIPCVGTTLQVNPISRTLRNPFLFECSYTEVDSVLVVPTTTGEEVVPIRALRYVVSPHEKSGPALVIPSIPHPRSTEYSTLNAMYQERYVKSGGTINSSSSSSLWTPESKCIWESITDSAQRIVENHKCSLAMREAAYVVASYYHTTKTEVPPELVRALRYITYVMIVMPSWRKHTLRSHNHDFPYFEMMSHVLHEDVFWHAYMNVCCWKVRDVLFHTVKSGNKFAAGVQRSNNNPNDADHRCERVEKTRKLLQLAGTSSSSLTSLLRKHATTPTAAVDHSSPRVIIRRKSDGVVIGVCVEPILIEAFVSKVKEVSSRECSRCASTDHLCQNCPYSFVPPSHFGITAEARRELTHYGTVEAEAMKPSPPPSSPPPIPLVKKAPVSASTTSLFGVPKKILPLDLRSTNGGGDVNSVTNHVCPYCHETFPNYPKLFSHVNRCPEKPSST